MFFASDVIASFGAHTESQESSWLPVAIWQQKNRYRKRMEAVLETAGETCEYRSLEKNGKVVGRMMRYLIHTEHVWARTHGLWHTSQSLYRHTHRGAKSIVIIGTLASSHNTHSDSQAHRQSNQHHIHTHEQFLTQYPLRLASTSTQQPSSYTHTHEQTHW